MPRLLTSETACPVLPLTPRSPLPCPHAEHSDKDALHQKAEEVRRDEAIRDYQERKQRVKEVGGSVLERLRQAAAAAAACL